MLISQKSNNKKFYICGLGNYGDHYQNHRHNFGSIVLHYLQQHLQFPATEDEHFLMYEQIMQDVMVTLLIPKSFMNCVGQILSKRLKYFKVDTQNLCVLHDDLEIVLGRVRYKFGQGAGGHNGLRSIDLALGNNYHRLRLGIGRPAHRCQVTDFVLSNFSRDEFLQVHKVCDCILHLLPNLINQDIDKVQEGCRNVG